MRKRYSLFVSVALASLCFVLTACSGNGGGTPESTRTFLMGATPFFATPSSLPDWRFENLDDKDLLSLHADDFWGVPWDQCTASGCTPPEAWIAKWADFANTAKSTGKSLYLALSPLQDRKRLAPKVDANGNPVRSWETANQIDGDGCYRFATDADAATYKAAYISYLKYLVTLVGPAYVSPAAEINIPFTQCPQQKDAWVAWYAEVHDAIKAAFPALPVFPTFQMEHLYGIADSQSACSIGVSRGACFDARLAEALTIPGDRIAFSTYPILWKYLADYSFTYPTDTYARVKSATSRKIWISETGWAAVKILQSYEHGGSGSCGADLFPASIANDAELGSYLSWLLGEAQNQQFEAVIWWLNRDYLDGAAAATCPCAPATSDTCVLSDIFSGADPVNGDLLLRLFANMALRYYDGSPRPAQASWHEYALRTLNPVP